MKENILWKGVPERRRGHKREGFFLIATSLTVTYDIWKRVYHEDLKS